VEQFGFLSACCVIFWMLSRPWSTASAGFTTRLPFRWHPASWLSESYVIGRKSWQSAFAFSSLLAVLGGTVLLPYPFCFVCWVFALAYLLPLWHVFLDTLKRDHAVKSRRIILYQPKSPLNSKVEKKTDPNGRLIEIAPEVYWFMDKSDMAQLAGATADDKKALAACRIAAGFYKAKVTTEFLQLFDSLSLYPYLVDHSNPKTMLALEDLARFFEGAKAGKILSPNGRTSDAPVSSTVTGGPIPREPVEPKRTENNLRRNPGSGAAPEPEQDSGAENSANLEFNFEDGTQGVAETAHVVVAVPPPGQTTRAQEEELQTVREQAIELPSGTAGGPPSKGKRGAEKPPGGQKRPLRFKPRGETSA
jgi:hypothetical protein